MHAWATPYCSVNISTWEAPPLAKQQDQVFNASDLASGHLAFENAVNKQQVVSTVKGNGIVSVHPNPVVNRKIDMVFNEFADKYYDMQLVDIGGNVILSKLIDIYSKTTSQIILPRNVASGSYIMKVNDSNGKEQYSGKIIVY